MVKFPSSQKKSAVISSRFTHFVKPFLDRNATLFLPSSSREAYRLDVKGKAIVIYVADQDSDAFARMFRDYPSSAEEKARIMAVCHRVTASLAV